MSLAILQSKGNFELFIKRLNNYDIGQAKTTAPSFKNFPDKLPMPAVFSASVSLSNFKTSSSEVEKKVKFLVFCIQKSFIVSQN